jgi:organic radical activating enzyme
MRLPFLETMITQACNISCLGCTNYSDLRHSGYVTWADGSRDIESWLDRIDINEFGIIGGEPLINPEWRDWIQGLRRMMPNAQLRFTTNGLLLDRALDILDLCESVGNIVFKITVHAHNDQLEEHIRFFKNSKPWTPVSEYGIDRWAGPNNVRFQINRPQKFVKSYKNDYHNMQPWHSDPAKAFDICCQKTCPLLYQGRIYKCSTSGLLKHTLERFGNPNIEQWQPYLSPGISVNDPNDVIQRFCDNFGLPDAICAQCPTKEHGVIDHYSTVVFKKKTLPIDQDISH